MVVQRAGVALTPQPGQAVRLPERPGITVYGSLVAFDADSWLALASPGDDGTWQLGLPYRKQIVTVQGPFAVQALAKLLPQLNRFGGSRERVKEAVALIEQESNPLRFFDVAARQATSRSKAKIAGLPEATRLALEMAAHEDSERRALEGELALLEQAWKEAEEVAAIADKLFLPSFVEDWMRKHRKG